MCVKTRSSQPYSATRRYAAARSTRTCHSSSETSSRTFEFVAFSVALMVVFSWHLQNRLPPRIVAAHSRHQLVAQSAQLVAQAARIVVDVAEPFTLFLDENFLLPDRRNRRVLAVFPERTK